MQTVIANTSLGEHIIFYGMEKLRIHNDKQRYGKRYMFITYFFFSFRGVKLIIILYNKVTGSATISKWQLHQQFFFGI